MQESDERRGLGIFVESPPSSLDRNDTLSQADRRVKGLCFDRIFGLGRVIKWDRMRCERKWRYKGMIFGVGVGFTMAERGTLGSW